MLLRHLARRRGDDSGSALVAVIGVLAVAAVVAGTLVTTTIHSAGFTSATRAGVQSQAAAEAGIDAVQGMLGSCASASYSSVAGTVPVFTAEVSWRASATDGWTAGCPTPTATEVRIVSTGHAAARGAAGQARGDRATMEAVYTPTPSGPPAPEFPRAVVGDRKISTVTGFTLTSSGDRPDVVTQGDFTCNTAMATGGALYVGGSFTGTSGCNPGGDVFVQGTFSCSDAMTVAGDLVVEGNVSFLSQTCAVDGDVWTGGTVTADASGDVGGDLWVKGDLLGSQPLSVGGSSVRVGGAVSSAARSAYGSRLVQPDSTLAAPDVSALYDAGTFPRIQASDSRWSAFAAESWRGLTEPLRLDTETWVDVCASQGSGWKGPLTIDTNTKLDTRGSGECPGGLSIGGAGFTFALNADLVIVVNAFNQNSTGKITVVSGDGAEHSLWIVHPWPASQTQCPSSTTSATVTLSSGDWEQDLTRVMLYSATGVGVSTSDSPSIRGQVYGCNVDLATSMALHHAPVGTTASTASVGPATFELVSKRDL